MSVAERYTKEIHEGLKYWAAWSPGVLLQLGDCGPVWDFVFHRERNIRDYGVDFSELPGRATEEWNYTSSKAVSWDVQAQADTQNIIPQVPQGQAGIRVSFTRENALVFVAPGGVQSSVADITKLKQDLIDKALDYGSPDLYPRDFAVITDLVKVQSATALISEGAAAEFVASATADLTAGLVSLGDVKLGIARKSAKSVNALLVARENVTPLFRGFKLKRGWWDSLKAVDLETVRDDESALPFVDIEPATLTA